MNTSASPLHGVRVLDFSAVLSGPIAATMLADQGADVIKVEPPEGDICRYIGPLKDDRSAMFIASNRGKRSMVLNLKKPAAIGIARELAQRADVVIENFRPGAMTRLGLDYEQLRAINPKVIYLSITGFGQDGPYAEGRVYDAVVQAVSGMAVAHRDRATGEPTLLATAICDKITAMTAAQAVSSALFARERNGQGQHIDLSMLDAALAFNWPDAMYNHVFMDDPPAPMPEFGASLKPWKTRDGYVATMQPQDDEFAALCAGFGLPDLIKDPRFATMRQRNLHQPQIRALLEPLAVQQSTEECVERMRAAGAPIGRVNDRRTLLDDPQVLHNGSLLAIEHATAGRARLARAAARFAVGEADVASPTPGPAPRLGEHTVAVLTELGHSPARIEEWLREKVIAIPRQPAA